MAHLFNWSCPIRCPALLMATGDRTSRFQQDASQWGSHRGDRRDIPSDWEEEDATTEAAAEKKKKQKRKKKKEEGHWKVLQKKRERREK